MLDEKTPGRWQRTAALQLALGLFAGGMLLCARAPNLQILLIGRVLMGTGAVFTPIAASIAVAIVEPALRGKALSATFLGMIQPEHIDAVSRHRMGSRGRRRSQCRPRICPPVVGRAGFSAVWRTDLVGRRPQPSADRCACAISRPP